MGFWHYELVTPLGEMWAAFDERGHVRHLAFGGLDPRSTTPVAPRAQRDAFRFLLRQFEAYFQRNLQSFTVPFVPEGTEFERCVWDRLVAIPYGQVRTFQEITRSLGEEATQEAVLAAIQANPIALLIPSHRVVDVDGSLVQYSGGLDRKRSLLDLEGVTLAPGAAQA